MRDQARHAAPGVSDDEARGILDAVPAGLYRTALNGRLIAANQHLAAMFGFPTVAALLETNAEDLYVDPADRQRLQAALVRDGTARMEVRLKRADGSWFWAEIRTRQVDTGGSPSLVGVINDVTDRRRLEQTASQFRRAAEASEEATFITDREGTFTYVNPAFTRLYGHTPEEVIGRCTPRILKSGDRDNPRYAAFWGTLLDKHPVREEFTNRRKDGSLLLVDASVSPILAEDGTIAGFLASQRDITARRQIENALRENEAQFRRVFDQLPVGTCLVAMDGRFHRANPAFCEMLGRTEAELKELTFVEVTHPDERDASFASGQDLRQGRIDHIEKQKRYLRKDGQVVWVELSVRLIRDAAGRPLWTMPVAVDITERRRLEQELLQRHKMEAIGQLAGGIAHDFNNILTAIMGYSELILDQIGPDKPMWADLRHILEGGQRAAGLTRQLLAFSRKQMLRLEVVNLNELLDRFQHFARPLIGEDITLDLDLSSAAVRTLADGSQLEQVIMNLLVNARDAMPDGGRITIRTAARTLDAEYARDHAPMQPGEYVELLVCDTGTGMTDEVKRHLFEPFFTTKDLGRGTGLGLATVYGIVKQMGGFVWVYSEEGHGTMFKIYFPSCDRQAEASRVSSEPGALVGKEHILLVEDDAHVRRFAEAVLRRHGYRVSQAANGADAIASLHQQTAWPDLILTDMVMPGMNGRELARKLREERPGTRVLFTSGYVDGRIADNGVLESEIDLLEKPFTAASLLASVREVLGRGSVEPAEANGTARQGTDEPAVRDRPAS